MSRKKYVVELLSDEREHLKSVISKGKAAAKTILKARILLKADQALWVKVGRMIVSAKPWIPTKA